MRSRLMVIALSILSTGCVGMAIPFVSAGIGAAATMPVVALRTGEVVLDSITWSKATDDSTSLVARGRLTWKKARMGPNNTQYLNLGGMTQSAVGTLPGAMGSFQIDLLGNDGKVMTSVAGSKVTAWDGKDPITMVPADKPVRFELRTTPVAWNVLRDAKTKTVKFVVGMR